MAETAGPESVGALSRGWAPHLARVGAAVRAAGPAPLVLIDGPSGSGKSTLAGLLTAGSAARPNRTEAVRLDDVYPGWGGLEAAGRMLARTLIGPLAAGRPGRVPLWDWAAGRPGAVRIVRPGGALVIEGCGAFAAGDGVPAVRVWIHAPDAARRREALARDGGAFDAHWDDWDRQWRRHLAVHGRGGAGVIRLRGLPGCRRPRPRDTVVP
ncbi:ATP-binding protein [Agromyces archimandritae]|uniref:ATP-binding protein n=1 Tax=Agromyces archimandritae TaxID=2781962 RepID=A0A975INR5_9MICO|nr:ATP-binding protein [Agromyces archimandritae]QTX04519.1 ATP-binding protein [Agromyces archimandritae]